MSAALSDKERLILATAWECFEVQPKVNYPLLAEKLGYKTSASANTAFLAAKKKLLLGTGAPPAKASPVAKSKGTGEKTKKKGGKRVMSEVEEDDEDENDIVSKEIKQNVEEDAGQDGVKVEDEGDGVDGGAGEASE